MKEFNENHATSDSYDILYLQPVVLTLNHRFPGGVRHLCRIDRSRRINPRARALK